MIVDPPIGLFANGDRTIPELINIYKNNWVNTYPAPRRFSQFYYDVLGVN